VRILDVIQRKAAKCGLLLTFHLVSKQAVSAGMGERNEGKESAREKRTHETDQCENILKKSGN